MYRQRSTKRIGELLVDAGLITDDQLQSALNAQSESGGRIVEVLISLGHLTVGDFVDFLAKQPGVASVDLHSYEIPRDVIALVPRDFAITHEVVPIDRLGRLLTVAMACPLDAATLQALTEMTGLRVKPVLCPANDVHETIRRYYPTQETMAAGGGAPPTHTAPPTPTADDEPAPPAEGEAQSLEGLAGAIRLQQAAQLVRKIDSLPALPETVQRVQAAMQDPEVSIEHVSQVVSLDPPVAAKVLGVANSAAYGFPSRVDSLQLAISLLGLRETYSIVLSAAVIDFFRQFKSFDYRSFWVSSLCCAAAVKIIGKAAGRRREPGLFAAGLLHDIGRVVLAHLAPQQYDSLPEHLHGAELLEAERDYIGLTHPEAGYELAVHWELPTELAEPIRFHHRPLEAQAAKDYVAIVALGTRLVHATGEQHEDNADLFAGLEPCLTMLGLDAENTEALVQEYLDRRDEAIREAIP